MQSFHSLQQREGGGGEAGASEAAHDEGAAQMPVSPSSDLDMESEPEEEIEFFGAYLSDYTRPSMFDGFGADQVGAAFAAAREEHRAEEAAAAEAAAAAAEAAAQPPGLPPAQDDDGNNNNDNGNENDDDDDEAFFSDYEGEYSDDEDDEEEDSEEEDSGNEEDDQDQAAMLFARLSNTVYRQLIDSLPRLSDHTPPPVEGDLADELTMRTAPVGLRSTTAPSTTTTTTTTTTTSNLCPRTHTPTKNHPKYLSPTRSLQLRELDPGCCGSGAHRRAAGNIAAFHRLPTMPVRVVDRMQSRAYIGRFTADGDVFVAAFQNERRIRLYDVHSESWSVLKDIHARNLRWTVTDLALSADQNFLLYASITPVVHLVNVRRGAGGTGEVQSVSNITDIHESLNFCEQSRSLGIWSLRWSPDSTEIIAGTGDASLYIYDIAAGRTVVKVQGHSDDVNAVAYGNDCDGNLIYTGSDDHEVRVWDRRTLGAHRGTPVGVFLGHTEGVAHLDSKGDGRYLISNSKDQSVKVWDVRQMRSVKEAARVHATEGRNIPSFSFDYRWMPYPAAGRVVKHPADGAVATYRGHSVLNTLCRAYWSPAATTGQRYIYVASSCGDVVIYDVISCAEVARLEYHQETVRDCSWHPYLPMLATAAFDGSVMMWEPNVPGDDEAAEEEAEESRKKEEKQKNNNKEENGGGSGGGGGGGDGSRKTRNSNKDGGGGGSGRRLPRPGRDQLGEWW